MEVGQTWFMRIGYRLYMRLDIHLRIWNFLVNEELHSTFLSSEIYDKFGHHLTTV